jgi:rubredoxin
MEDIKMEENKYTQFISKYRNANTAVSDEDMAKAIGGLGGKNEATCPVCGKPMTLVNNPYGDNYWTCPTCKVDQFFSDAEYIEVVKMLEAAGQTQGIVYPVWWDKVK